MPEKTFDINISRVRRAIDFSSDFTGGEKLIAGVIADHFNAKEGYAFPTYGYLESVYGFTPSMIWKTVTKIKSGWMEVDKSGGNNCYCPNMQKVESVLAGLDAKRKSWKKRDAESRSAPETGAGSRGEGDTSREEGGTSHGEAEAPLVESPNAQVNAQPNAQSKDQVSRTRSDERVKRTDATFGKGRPSGEPAGSDDLGQFIADMHQILPAHEPFDGDDDRGPFDAERSRRGELPQLQKLIRAGWTLDELQEMVETYLRCAHDDKFRAGNSYKQTYKTLSAIFAELFDKTKDQAGFEGDDEFYGRRLPERFLRKPEDRRSSANDNWRHDRASGES